MPMPIVGFVGDGCQSLMVSHSPLMPRQVVAGARFDRSRQAGAFGESTARISVHLTEV
jgi:hypothetical protein